MLFSTSSKISSKQSPEQVKAALLGKHVNIKELDFIFKESNGMLKVIPDTENDERARIVPITHLVLNPTNNGTQINVSSKPRRIDLGGLYMVVSFILLLALIAVYLRITYPEYSPWISFGVFGVAILVFIIFRIRLQSSYYGYVGNIKSFIKSQSAA